MLSKDLSKGWNAQTPKKTIKYFCCYLNVRSNGEFKRVENLFLMKKTTIVAYNM